MNFFSDNFTDLVIGFFKFLWLNVTKLFLWTFGFYLLPTFEYVLVTITFIVISLYTNIRRLKYENKWGGSKDRKRLYIQNFHKLILYSLGILATYIFQHHIAKDLVQIMYFFVAIITVRELSTIINDIETITGVKIWLYLKKYILQIFKINDNNNNANDA